jgi:nucleotide-binding universal stress UspA family protein
MSAKADGTVHEARGRLTRPGLNVEAIVLRGRPATAIVDQARGMQADLVVVGSRGHGMIESMLLGSVSAEVIDHASAPVLVARGRRIERVVLGWDGSSCASRAADLLRT